MSNNKTERDKLLSWFIKGTFFKKDFPKDGRNSTCELNIKCKDDVLLAVEKAYIDMTPRTFKSKDKNKKTDIDQKEKMKVLSALAKNIFNYINNNQKYDDFDKWHNNICVEFINNFNKVLEKANREQAKYGKAQKIVNMTFKYLYCFDDADEYHELFKKCHMAIDSYILSWYNKNVTPEGNKITKSWSNLEYDEYSNEYIEIQDNIKNYLKNNNEYSEFPFFAEFTIWQEKKAAVIN